MPAPAPWFLPDAFLGEAQPLKGPNTWLEDGPTLPIDIVPVGNYPTFSPGGRTMDVMSDATHVGFAATRGQVTNPGQWRLVWCGETYKILMIRDFAGFIQFDLARVVGG